VVIDDIRSFDQARAAASLGCDRGLGDLWGAAQPASAIDEHFRREPVGARAGTTGR
jgi:EAL domain-containing protein (putative c-di-GMP-specific phosphodiesterase class I)